jgi:hypothetical protein
MFEKETCVKKLPVVGLVLLTVGMAGAFLAWEFAFSPRAAFRRYVVHPIPRSVRNIRVDHTWKTPLSSRLQSYLRRSVFVLRFDISKEDLQRILGSREFRVCKSCSCTEGGTVKYVITRISYTTFRGHDEINTSNEPMYIYLWPVGRPVPSWFDLDKWTEPNGYMAGQDYMSPGWVDVSLLVYNEQLGSAYMIKYEASGW